MNIPVILGLELEEEGMTQRVTFTLNGIPFYSYPPGTRYEEYAAELAMKKLGSVLAKLLQQEEE